MLHFNFSKFPDLSTARLNLRKLRNSDNYDIYKLRSNTKVNEFLDRSICANINEADSFIERINSGIKENNCLYWAIIEKAEDALIGTICLWHFSPEGLEAEIGYELIPEFQGQGFMQEAIAFVIDYAFNSLRLTAINAICNKKNIKSVQLLQRIGFRQRLEDCRLIEKTEDEDVYKLIKEDVRRH